ncbi:MAG: hypothetical protein GQ531_10230 [Sulfurovum sp.]|nr:hypothetical protein [Sulfurovum sp.]
MKKIFVVLMALTLGLMAENEVKLFDNTKTQIGGMVGKSIVYTYPDNDMAKYTDPTMLKKLKENVEKSICSGEDERALVNKGYHVIFIYPGEKKTSIFSISDCKGYPKPE